MRIWITLFFVFFTLVGRASETRCGWLDNPSPTNMWLIDRDGTWDISFQGGDSSLDDQSLELAYQAIENNKEFVRTNRNYGFSCACLTVDVDKEKNSVIAIHKAKQLGLKQCLEDIYITKFIPLPFK